MSITISIRSLCTSEDSLDISISISISFLLMLMFMLMFSGDIIDISITARKLADSLALMLILMSTCPHWTL